jgi:amidase
VPQAAVDHAARLCREFGHETMHTPLPHGVDYDGFIEALIDVMATNIAVSSDARLKALGRSLQPGDLEPAMMEGYERGKRMTATRYVDCISHFHALGRVLEGFMAEGGFDLVLTPALARLPACLGELSMRGPSFADFRRNVARYTPFLAVVNAAGLPAACLPLSWTEASLPVATQLIGRFGREDLLLAISAQLEQLAPWSGRMPPTHRR